MTLESCKVRQESALLPGISYGFDDLGRLTGVSDPSATYQYTLDDLGRVVTQTVSCVGLLVPSVTLSQTFDDDSNRTQLAATVGTTADFVTDYTYDALDRVTYIVQQDQTGGNAVSDKLARFAYNDAGDFTYIWRYAATSTASNYVGRTKYIAYDNAGRVTDFKHDGSGLAAIDFDVRYDDTLLDYVTYSGTTTDYSYDSVDQLTGIDYTGTGTPADQTYSYDDSGNRTNTGYSTGEYNQLEDDGTYTYSYDYNGNRERRFDSSGNQVKYFWDHRNRLTRVDVRNSSGVTLQRYTFEYDAYNRLVTKTVDSNADGTVDATYHWVYDGDQAVLQFDGNAAADLSHRYLWGPVVDQAVLQFDGNAAADLSHRYLWGPVVDQLLADETVDDGGTEDVFVGVHGLAGERAAPGQLRREHVGHVDRESQVLRCLRERGERDELGRGHDLRVYGPDVGRRPRLAEQPEPVVRSWGGEVVDGRPGGFWGGGSEFVSVCGELAGGFG